MITKQEALALIEGKLEEKGRLVLALDGMSASGKSTFARALAERFAGSVVHMDDFFLPAERFTPEKQALPGGNIDRERFQHEVLLPLHDDLILEINPDTRTIMLEIPDGLL